MLIKSYGEFWNPDIVDWGTVGYGNRGHMVGKVKENNRSFDIDFWEAKGIYILYHDYKAVYVGKAYSNGMGPRLRNHLSDRLAGRWDMFSWYSVCSPRITQGDVSSPGNRRLSPDTIINTLEALAIIVSNPSLNRRQESLSGALEATQPSNTNNMTIRKYLTEILSRLPSEPRN